MIIVDTREFKSRVVKELFKKDVTMQSLQLSVGDYLIGENICVERKSVKDFVDSLIDKRIFTQLNNMKLNYKKPLLLVEGIDSVYSVRRVHPNAIRGLILSIIVDYNIPIIFSKDEVETCEFLIGLLKRSDKTPNPLLKKNKKVNIKDVQESIVQSLPGLGVKTSKKILSDFKTIKNLFSASVNDLIGVESVGAKSAEKIFEIANKEYKD